jgi:hypothetical protein
VAYDRGDLGAVEADHHRAHHSLPSHSKSGSDHGLWLSRIISTLRSRTTSRPK